ncbi:MAG: thioredoxin fold domain-containing protein [Halieaceae bacterium]|jgi:PQQ-dependent catabolism-associated CXXCW motif protein|nr:thioredoxin fold domain-containing protein [Halieaceae bacterium]
MIRLARRLALGLLLLAEPLAAADQGFFNEAGYRSKHYRRPTPANPPAGQMLSTEQLAAFIASDAPVLIDVQAVTVRPEIEEFGLSWLPDSPRMHIEGSTWLPNVGYAELDDRMTHFFRSNLERLSGGDFGRALVFYCVVDCWMSWNAIRRADSWGYSNLYWYPDGTDGWRDAGLPLVHGEPQPLEALPTPERREFFRTVHRLDLAALGREAAESGRELLLFFETEDCQFCLRMRRTVLNDAALVDRLHEDFIAVAIDMASAETARGSDGQPVSLNLLATRDYRVVGTPTLVFLDADFDVLHRHSGLVATAREMQRLLDFVSQRAFDEESWQTFKRR